MGGREGLVWKKEAGAVVLEEEGRMGWLTPEGWPEEMRDHSDNCEDWKLA